MGKIDKYQCWLIFFGVAGIGIFVSVVVDPTTIKIMGIFLAILLLALMINIAMIFGSKYSKNLNDTFTPDGKDVYLYRYRRFCLACGRHIFIAYSFLIVYSIITWAEGLQILFSAILCGLFAVAIKYAVMVLKIAVDAMIASSSPDLDLE